jgi:hypothetical protein
VIDDHAVDGTSARMTVRALLVVLLAAVVMIAAPTATAQANDVTATAADGYVYGYAPVVVARTRAQLLCGGAVNTLRGLPVPPNPLVRAVVAPSPDLLYSNAFLDLRQGPVTVSYPETGGRYTVFQVLDLYTNVLGNIGTRSDGPGPSSVTIVPPGYTGPVQGQRRIASTTWDVWLLGRTLVAGAAVPDARTLQAGYRITVDGPAPAHSPPPLRQRPCVGASPHDPASAGAGFFDELAGILAANPPPEADRPMLDALAGIGVVPGATPSTGPDSRALAAGVVDGDSRVAADVASTFTPVGQWRTLFTAGSFGTDYLLRAHTARVALAANERAETAYFATGVDATGVPLDGNRTYRIHLPDADPLVPVDPARSGWWSVTVYDAAGFLVPNLALRYSIGADPSTLAVNPDGSVDVVIGADPSDGNWLPAPRGGFQVFFRQYVPSDLAWVPPRLEPA